MSIHLPHHPPRPYTLIEAYRGRVWRNKWGLYSRETGLFGICLCIYGLLLGLDFWMLLGVLIGIISIFCAGLGSLWVNFKRVRLVQVGQAVQGRIRSKKRVLLLHEMIRPHAHRTFKMSYEYMVDNETYQQTLYLCLCAYEHLNDGEELMIAHHSDSPKKSIPLRVAVMVIPH